MDTGEDSAKSAVIDNLKLLANNTMSTSSLKKCWALAKVICNKLGITLAFEARELDDETILRLSQILTQVVQDQRPLALTLIERDPNNKPRESQLVAAAGELLAVPYENNENEVVCNKRLRKELRGIADDAWEAMCAKNNTDKKKRQLWAGLWLKQQDTYAYKAAENREIELLQALLAAAEIQASKTSRSPKNDPTETVTILTSNRNNEFPHYAHRSALERLFDSHVNNGAKLIAFVGEAGMGKTTLAKALTYVSNELPTPIIEFNTGQVNLNHLGRWLGRYGLGRRGLSQSNARQYLASLLDKEDGPKFVVLDNLEDTGELVDIAQYPTRSIVVATCRRNSEFIPEECRLVWVREMTIDEAIDMTKRRLLDVSDEDSKLIAEELYCHPLAIHVAYGYITCVPGMSVKSFCRNLRLRPHGLHTRTNRETLQAVLHDTVEAIRKVDSFALIILVSTAFNYLGQEYPKVPFFNRLVNIQDLASIFFDSSQKDLMYAQAIKRLCEFCLVRIEEDGYTKLHQACHKRIDDPYAAEIFTIFSLELDGYLVIHPLTRTILCDVLEGDMHHTLASLSDIFVQKVNKTQVEEDTTQVIALFGYILNLTDCIRLHYLNRGTWQVHENRLLSPLSGSFKEAVARAFGHSSEFPHK